MWLSPRTPAYRVPFGVQRSKFNIRKIKRQLITYSHRARIRCTPNFKDRLDISIRNLTSTWHFHKYATPWQLCYNRDKENLFHSLVRERQADKNINWMTVVSRNEKINHALRWTRISYDKMLIDWVKSYIIPIYTYEVAAFSG